MQVNLINLLSKKIWKNAIDTTKKPKRLKF